MVRAATSNFTVIQCLSGVRPETHFPLPPGERVGERGVPNQGLVTRSLALSLKGEGVSWMGTIQSASKEFFSQTLSSRWGRGDCFSGLAMSIRYHGMTDHLYSPRQLRSACFAPLAQASEYPVSPPLRHRRLPPDPCARLSRSRGRPPSCPLSCVEASIGEPRP